MPAKKRKQNKKRAKKKNPFKAKHLTPVSEIQLPSDGAIWLVCGYDPFLGRRKQMAGPFTEPEAEKVMERIKAHEATVPDYDRVIDIKLERAIFVSNRRPIDVKPMTDKQVEEHNRRWEEYRAKKKAWEEGGSRQSP